MRDYERGPDGTWHDGLLMDLLARDFDGRGAVTTVTDAPTSCATIVSTMRAMRRLRPDPVPIDLLLQLVEAGRPGRRAPRTSKARTS